MERESLNSQLQNNSSSSKKSQGVSRILQSLISQSDFNLMPYRSKLEILSIGSNKSRESRDSDLLNRLAKDSSKSSRSLKKYSDFQVQVQNANFHSQMDSSYSNSNASASDKSSGRKSDFKPIETYNLAPKIHNCVCFAAGQCLSYNCNCFLSPYPCAPDCCPNCLILRSNLPLKVTNMCNCKKTKCMKLYCQCLAKGEFCTVMCRCELCQNHANSTSRVQVLNNFNIHKGCSCQKSNCKKKYCQCFANNLKCTNRCGCFNCHNYIETVQKKAPDMVPQLSLPNDQMDVEMQFQDINFFGGSNKR